MSGYKFSINLFSFAFLMYLIFFFLFYFHCIVAKNKGSSSVKLVC